MTLMAPPVTYTPEEVSRLSDLHDKLYELVGGQLVEKQNMSSKANWISAQVIFLLKSAYPATKAWIFPEQPTYCFKDGHCRRPDVCLVWTDRLPNGPDDDELYLAPDLVVEVVSPTNKFEDQYERVAEYLDAGVPLVWVVQPGLRWIHIYRNDGAPGLLKAGDIMNDEPLLPGLSFNVADLFPPALTKTGKP